MLFLVGILVIVAGMIVRMVTVFPVSLVGVIVILVGVLMVGFGMQQK